MPYVKSTVHITRIAGAALKSFTHGYAQTVVAASQSSHAASNTPTGPLYDTLLGRFRKSERSRLHNVHNVQDSARHASTSAGPSGKPDSALQDAGLDKYFDAWQRHQRSGAKEWQQFEFAKRIEWQPPSVVPTNVQEAEFAHEVTESASEQAPSAPALKRSYTTSALDNFGKAFSNDVAAEAAALEQVNNAIAEEIQKAKDDLDDVLTLKTRSISHTSLDQASVSLSQALPYSPPTSVSDSADASPSSPFHEYEQKLVQLAEKGQHENIPLVFRDMLRAGVQQPSSAAYRALLASAIALTHGRHTRVPKALEVYSDMLRRKVTPDTTTYSMLIGLLASRSSECLAIRKDLDATLLRYGARERPGEFMFGSSQSEHAIVLEDSSVSLAVRLFDRAIDAGLHQLDMPACAALVIACAEHGRLEDMQRVYDHIQDRVPTSAIYPHMITAFGVAGDLRMAVESYEQYKELAIDNNSSNNNIRRIDHEVYASLIKAYGSAGRLKGGLKFLSSVQNGLSQADELDRLREVVALEALLPLALQDQTLQSVFDLVPSLSERAQVSALADAVAHAADHNMLETSVKAFDMLAACTVELIKPATAMLAMHIRNANVEAAEPYWRLLESAPASVDLIQPTTMRALALIGQGQWERALRQSRRMFSRIRDHPTNTTATEVGEQIDEAIELMSKFMLRNLGPVPAEASAEMLRTMMENGGLIPTIADHIVARMGPEQIACLSAADVELLARIQCSMILEESSADLAGPARFRCLLDNITSRSIMPSLETETLIERTLINIDQPEASRLWNAYRYPQTPVSAPFSPIVPSVVPPNTDDSFDPYSARTDVRGSNIINDLLERPQGRRLDEALTKFRNMRRVGRVPRMFTYGKLIEVTAKENKLDVGREVLEMAKQDVPFDPRYRVVRYGWQHILDHMVSACLTVGRRDLAARYHQDMLDLGIAPSANTFGLYITTLKENTKTFDEASEAVKIFLRAKAEGVEPTSFLYNALIGKLGKARRIDDCLFYFAEMRNLGIRPTSVTYGTIVNALCRVSDDKFAEEIFEEMEACTNYKARPAPYHSLMQFFLSTKRDKSKVLAYYDRMRSKNIEPTVHTFKLLIDTHATLEPVNMQAAEQVLAEMQDAGIEPGAVHYAALIHAQGCVLHDMEGARKLMDKVVSGGRVRLLPCIYQAMFESLNANHLVSESDALLADLSTRRVEFTPYIANALIHGWTLEKDVSKAKAAFDRVPLSKREPSTYEAMVRAYLAAEDRTSAKGVVREALSRGYPAAVASKISDLISFR